MVSGKYEMVTEGRLARGLWGGHPFPVFSFPIFLLWFFLGGLVPPSVQAQTPSNDPIRFVLWAGQDAQALVRNVPTRQTLYLVAATGGTLLLLSNVDDTLTDGAIDLAEGAGSTTRRFANEIGNIKTVRPAALMIFLGSLLSESTRLQDAAFTSLEAILLSNLITNALKTAVGRARPTENKGEQHFSPFSGSRSFPSGHATTVFAFTTPWLLYYRTAPTYVLFALGIGTALTRMIDEAHWFSDVLVGTGIGLTTGALLTRRHRREQAGVSVTPVVAAGRAGVSLRIRL